MKPLFILFSLMFLLITAKSLAQVGADQVCGTWLNEEGSSQIEIYEEAGQFFGRISWLKQPSGRNGQPLTDRNNPDPELKDRPILGMVLISDLEYRRGAWTKGHIYSPKRGQTADCSIKIRKDGTLQLTVSKSFFSTTQIWTRV